MSDQDELYALVNDLLGGADLSPRERRRLRGTYEWADLAAPHGDLEMQAEECAFRVRSWRRLEDVGERLPTGDMPPGEAARLEAKALLCWALANEDPEVDEWRTEHLEGELLAVEDGPDRLERLRRAVGEWVLERAGDAGRVSGLAFPDGEVVGWVSTTPGSVLDDLRQLSERLAAEYSWPEDTATAFVLTDAVPMPKWVEVTDHWHYSPAGRLGRRVILDVDPDTPANVVRDIYNGHRAEHGLAHRPPARATLSRFADWVSSGRIGPSELVGDESARRSLSRCWRYFTGEPLSRRTGRP